MSQLRIELFNWCKNISCILYICIKINTFEHINSNHVSLSIAKRLKIRSRKNFTTTRSIISCEVKRIPYNKKYVRITQEPWELSTKIAKISRTRKFNHLKSFENNVTKSLKQVANEKSCFKVIVCSRFFKRFNFFTFENFLSNIFCSFSRRKRFCFLSRCSLTKKARNCFVAINWVVFIFIFSSSSFVNARSIASKFIIETTSSHFFLLRMHFAHFLNKEDKRHFNCRRAHLWQDIIVVTPLNLTRRYSCSRREDMRHDDRILWGEESKRRG